MQKAPLPPLTSEPTTPEEEVMAAMVTVGRRLRQRLPGDEVDFSAIPLMKVLHHEGPTRLSVLAEHLELDASTVSRHAKHLEDRGMVQRACDPDDGRASRVALSEQGRRCLADGAARRRALIAEAMKDWSPADREQLQVLLTRLRTDLTSTPTPQESA
jgi:DNA-binding MarR family transcriptional regulator